MNKGNKNLFRDKSDAKNFKPSLEIEVGQKRKTFHSERGNYV